MQTLRLAAAVLALGLVSPTAGAQQAPAPRTRVLLLSLEESGNRFDRAFRAALGRIPDVQLVDQEDQADLRLSVLAICVPRGAGCAKVVTYAVSVTFEEPLTTADLFDALRATTDTVSLERRMGTGDQIRLAEALRPELVAYRRVLRRFAASWGRAVVESAVDETISEFDANCLEQRRLRDRALRAGNVGDVGAAHRLRLRLEERPERWWSC